MRKKNCCPPGDQKTVSTRCVSIQRPTNNRECGIFILDTSHFQWKSVEVVFLPFLCAYVRHRVVNVIASNRFPLRCVFHIYTLHNLILFSHLINVFLDFICIYWIILIARARTISFDWLEWAIELYELIG